VSLRILVDTCHSGEVDPKMKLGGPAPAGEGQVRGRFAGKRGLVRTGGARSFEALLAAIGELFVDLRTGNGAAFLGTLTVDSTI
jgi:hypothetical protein